MKLNTLILKEKIEKVLPLNKYGFRLSTQFENLYLIYQSKKCKLRFEIDRIDYDQDVYHVHYGRSHALDDESVMDWQGEQWYCWYGYSETQDILKYLDGLSPEEAYKTTWEYLKEKWKPYGLFENPINKSLKLDEDWLLKIHVKIWGMYGNRFFDIFDMQHPNNWKKYHDFLTNMYQVDEPRYKQKGLIPKNKYC
ncbi:MAG: hypothetical protein J0M11_14135 [Anaerolineae bacterium]|nr:hypothetical protein [Anaerolineae bacterium]